jgi:hypothetical protein
MTDMLQLRTSVVGLLGSAAVEEELLLASAAGDEAGQGSPACWAAAPLIAHNTEFKRQQVTRLTAIRQGEPPPEFAEIDHRSAEVYLACSQRSAAEVRQASREVTAALIDGLNSTGDDDLLDPARHPWLRGRALWLQIIVRGFWHPLGHIADYHVGHGRAARAVELQAHAVAVASYLQAPEQARGMAHYSLACAQARTGLADAALVQLRQACRLNPDLAAKAGSEPDLAELRRGGQLEALLIS